MPIQQISSAQIANSSITNAKIASGTITQDKLDANISVGLKVTGITYPGDDTAANTNGGQTITVTGAGFASTPTVYIDNTIAPSVTFVSSTQITFTTPAKAAGTYNVYVINPDGSVGIRVMGISYSGEPAWTTAAGSLGTYGETISIQLIATGDTPLVYTLTTGSSLPANVSLSSSGLISGNVGSDQTFSFSVDVTDPQNQTTPRSFSVTIVIGDEYFENVILLLQGNATNGSNNNVFLDSSNNNFAITRNGNTTQGTFTPFSKPDGRWSIYLDGSGDYLTVPYNTADFDWWTGDFTVEAWIFLSGPGWEGSSGQPALIGNMDANSGTNYWSFGINASRQPSFYYFNSTSVQVNYTSQVATFGTWHHIAMCKNSTGIQLFLNGNGSSNTSVSGSPQSSTGTPLTLGQINAGGCLGYVSNLRIVKGTVLYSGSSYTVPTAPFSNITNTKLLMCQDRLFRDNSSSNRTITRYGDTRVAPFSPFPSLTLYSAGTKGGSGYFDGTDDRLSIAETSATRPGSSNFCFECFFYPTALPTIGTAATDYATLFSQGTSGVYAPLNVYYAGDKKIMVNISSTGSSWDIANTVKSNGTCELNQWTHVAMTRNGNNFDLYLNGVFDKTIATSSATLMAPTEPTYIGLRTGAGSPYPFTGYISSWRWVVGSAVYTSAFTPPTAPVTAISNTQLLLNYTNGGIIDNSMSSNLETANNAQIDTGTKKYGTGALEFDGVNDRIFIPTNPDISMGYSNFTIECWFYLRNYHASATAIVWLKRTAVAGVGFIFGVAPTSAGNVFRFWTGDSDTTNPAGIGWDVQLNSSTAISTNTWTHVAGTRSGSTWRLFINGTEEANATADFAISDGTGTAIIGGSESTPNFDGFIDDLRISKGIARYTSNFTPPGEFAGKGV